VGNRQSCREHSISSLLALNPAANPAEVCWMDADLWPRSNRSFVFFSLMQYLSRAILNAHAKCLQWQFCSSTDMSPPSLGGRFILTYDREMRLLNELASSCRRVRRLAAMRRGIWQVIEWVCRRPRSLADVSLMLLPMLWRKKGVSICPHYPRSA